MHPITGVFLSYHVPVRAYDNGTWYCAAPTTVSYYMDIRNWLTENYIFAFETLSYDEDTQTIDGVNKILANTFMNKETNVRDLYARIGSDITNYNRKSIFWLM